MIGVLDWTEFGVLGAVCSVLFGALGAILVAIYKLATKAIDRAFHEDKGIVTMAVNKHLQALDNTVETQQKIMEHQEINTKLLTDLDEAHRDPNSTFSTVKLVLALKEFARIARQLSAGSEVATSIEEHVGEILRLTETNFEMPNP